MNSITLQGHIVQNPELRYTSDDQQIPVATTVLEFLQMGAKGENVPVYVVIKGWGKNHSAALMKATEGADVLITGSLRMEKVQRENYVETKAEISITGIVIM